MDLHKKVPVLFDYFYRKIYKTAGFKLDVSGRNGKYVDSFVQLLSKQYRIESIGINFLVDYFAFAFEYWSNKKTKRHITLGWIIGKKTFQRWLVKSDNYKYFVNKFLQDYDVILSVLMTDLIDEELIRGLDPAEEKEKLRFTGAARLYNCWHYTTLYNHRSGTCMICPLKIDCKKLLKLKFPNSYKKRGYE